MQLFGLLGFPLGHSFSKTYFTEKFKAEKIDAEFVNFESDNHDPVQGEDHPLSRPY